MKKIVKQLRLKRLLLILFDVIIIAIAYFGLQFFIRDTFTLSQEIVKQITNTIILAIVSYEIVFFAFKLYWNIIRYESGKDYLIYILACILACTLLSTIGEIVNLNILPIKHNVVTAAIIAMLAITYRVIARMLLNYDLKVEKHISKDSKKRLLIIGAGSATRIIIQSIKHNMNEAYNIIGIIDDNEEKKGCTISGVKILGNRYDIISICEKYNVDIIFFSISNIENPDRKEILELCQKTKTKVRILPSTEDIIKNKKLLDNLRDVEIEDLLGRDPIKLDNENISELIENKVVLVTGGGGSIGSELCRQIVKYHPNKLVIVDIYENNLYDIEQELKFKFPEQEVKAIVASVRDKARLNEIFEEFKPYLVFHAAAHKHVPLMETSPLEAIKNNVFGTYNVVNCADEYNVKRFILISTDKAVNPTNIMGATKRMCEMIVQAKNKVSNTEYAAVRFGNVLGSNGSVIPLFKKQIASGGPVTVTHKEITRFFMTIPEAVSLVLQAMSYAKGGEIFVLDMGEPVKIYDMAEKLIKLSGYEPNVDIKIKVTGLRPGEKLYEELLMEEEGLEETKHDKIFIAPPLEIDMNNIKEKLEKLDNILKTNNNEQKDEIKKVVNEVVPTYKLQ